MKFKANTEMLKMCGMADIDSFIYTLGNINLIILDLVCKFSLFSGAFGLLSKGDQYLDCQLQLRWPEISAISMTT